MIAWTMLADMILHLLVNSMILEIFKSLSHVYLLEHFNKYFSFHIFHRSTFGKVQLCKFLFSLWGLTAVVMFCIMMDNGCNG